MANTFGTDAQTGMGATAFNAPAFHAQAVTPSDSVDLPTVARALYIGVTGNVTLVTVNNETVLFVAVPVGILPVMTRRVQSTGTAATNIVALW